MTNGWIDIKNTDVMLIMGGNPAENHPCGFKWPIEAKLQRNAKMIVVDPRFTRTAATADLFLQIRAGTDIAFLGGLVNYAIGNNRIAKDYLVNYTNAAFIVKEGFKLPDDGLYSGFEVATIIYAVGWTQHTFGTQIIRTAAILQLLLGNVGRAGGGVNALRGHSNIQGATDMGGVFDILPGYLKVPAPNDVDLATYIKRTTPTASKPGLWDSYNYYSNTSKFITSYLKALYGDAAKKENDFAFHYLPKVDRNYSWTELWDGMYGGRVKGLFAFGMNGVAIGPNTHKNIEALKKADWLVVCDLYPEETAEFWRAPGTTQEEMKKINTTVYRLPGAGFAEKDGTFVNSARG